MALNILLIVHCMTHGYVDQSKGFPKKGLRPIMITIWWVVKGRRQLPKSNSILGLNPVLDEEGIIRVGGRLQRSDFDFREQNPIFVTGNHHIAKLLVLHFH